MISLGMIVRDASATLERCLESVAPYVDEIVIGLGGESTDNTEEIARKFTDKIIPIQWHDDFAEARNIVLKATTGDYYLWLDADDELIGGEHMRRLIAEHPDIEAFYWGYNYAQDDADNCVCYLIRERLIKKNRRWSWVGAIHEVLMGPPDHRRFIVPEILVKHHPQPREGTRNLDILRSELEKTEPNPDARTLVYLGSECATRGLFQEALVHLQRYVAVGGFDEEKYQAQHRVADIHRTLGNLDKARLADFKAIAIRPDWPDAYFGLAETAFFQKNYRECVKWTEIGATQQPPQTMLIVNPRDYDFHPLVMLANAYANLRDFEMAAENFRKAVQILPHDQLFYNLKAMEEELAGHKLVDSFLHLWTHLGQNDEWLKARNLIDCLPKLIEQTPPVLEKSQFTRAVTAHVENPQLMIDEYVGNPHWTPMPDENLDSVGWRRHPRLQFARKVAQGSKLLLDLGSSDGFMSIPLIEEGVVKAVRGIDLDPRCVEIANRRADERKVDAVYQQGDLQTYELGHKADVALLFEVIEHVVDPEALLAQVEKSASRVAITTPHLAWQSPAPGWDTKELKGHLRIFTVEDLERMLGARGRISNLYREPFGNTGWIFADYRPGERTNGHVTILAPGAPEPWSPRTFEREGLGGSETAIIGLGEGFAKLGKQVSVFSTISDEGYYNSVRYRDQSRFVPGIRSDVLIAWRAPELIDNQVNASRSILWMHDTDVGDRLTPARAAKFESIVVLTEWHKQHMLQMYPFLEPEKLVVIPNGVNLSLFAGPAPVRDKNRVVYSSSPDRGLDTILEFIWPRVLEQVPEAELHIYYGWNNFDKFLPVFPHLAEFKNKVMGLISKSRNVVQHGRVDQKTLAREMRGGNIWLYPTSFTETYCITAVEAQLAGLHPITNNLAALSETVKSGVILDVEEIQKNPSDALALMVEATVQALRYPATDEYRAEVKRRAPAVSWDQVAVEWNNRWLA